MQLCDPVKDYGLGFIYLETSLAKNGNGLKNGYQWESSKIAVKLSFADILLLVSAIRFNQAGRVYHEYKGLSKNVILEPTSSGKFFLKVNESVTNANPTIKTIIVLSKEDAYGMSIMLEAAISIIHRWN